MQNYYSLYTWAMDHQASLEREATRHRISRNSGRRRWSLRWPLGRSQRTDAHDHQHSHHQPGAAA